MKNTLKTSNGKKGGLFVGKSHAKGGIPAIVVDTGQPIEVEGGEAIINKEATKKYWKQLSSINQSAGNGNPIPPPTNLSDNPDEYKKGGKISKIAIMQGTKHELEHSDTIKSFTKADVSVKEIARKIAIDHLQENPNYYKILTKLKLATGGEIVCRSCSNSWFKNHKDVGMNVYECEKCGNNNHKFYKGGLTSDMSKSEIKAFYASPEGKKLDAETHAEWKRLVNMSKSELQAFYDSEEGKTAGLSKAKADELGISNGRTSARWILKMKDIPYTEWTFQMWVWAKKQISFIKRMSKNRGSLYEPNGKKTNKYLSLLIWGHDPEKYANGGKTHTTIKKFYRGDKVDEISSINDIAKATREFVKKKFPKTKWSITVDKFSGGQALRVYLISAPFNPIKDEQPWGEAIGGGKYLSVNQYSFEKSESYTDEAKKVLKSVRDFYNQYNYDNSDPMSDYTNVRFYETLGIGKYDKGFVQTEASKPSKPKPSLPDSGGNTTPKFTVGSTVKYETSKGIYEGEIQYAKYVVGRDTYIYGIKSSNEKVYAVWESKIMPKETPEAPSDSKEYSEQEIKDYSLFINEMGVVYNPKIDTYYLPKIQPNPEKKEIKVVLVALNKENENDILIDSKQGILDLVNYRSVSPLDVKDSKELLRIDVVWSENGDLQPQEFNSWEDFQSALENVKLPTDGTYDKTKIFILWKNGKLLVDRIDLSKFDYDPKSKNIGVYLSILDSAMYYSNFRNRLEEANWSDVQETPEIPLTYKVGDVFRINMTEQEPPNTERTFTIISIGKEKTQYRTDFLDKGTSRLSTRMNSRVLEDIAETWWIPFEGNVEEAETSENDAVKELDLELETINDLRKLDLFDFPLQNETRFEINDLLNTREVFMESEKFNILNSINDYFTRATEPINIDTTDKNIVLETTKSKAFKDWFGDWQNESFPSSKVINFTPEEGAFVPQIVYHGTWAKAHYSRFKTNKFPIIYFATNRKYAEWFANLGSGIIYECFLNVRFPLDFRPLGLLDVSWNELTEFFKMNYGLDLPESNVTSKMKVWAWIRMDGQNDMKLINFIRNSGFDGMMHIENNPQQLDAFGNEETTTAIMIFNADQAKLVKYAGSTTGFSDIMFLEKGGKIEDDLLSEIKKLRK